MTQGVVDAVIDAVGEQHVVRLELEIGQLSGVAAESVRFCFDLVVTGTPLDGARLDIVELPGSAACGVCGTEFELRKLILLCECGSTEVLILTGLEFRVRSVEVE